MNNQEKSRIRRFGVVETVEKLTADQYVVMQLQRAENTISRNKIYMENIERENSILKRDNDEMLKILKFIFENFEFEIRHYILCVTAGHAEITDSKIISNIEGLTSLYGQNKEEKK